MLPRLLIVRYYIPGVNGFKFLNLSVAPVWAPNPPTPDTVPSSPEYYSREGEELVGLWTAKGTG